MIKILGERGSGKTIELIKKANEANGVIVCQDPKYIIRNLYFLEAFNVEVVSYLEYKNLKTYESDRKIFIDDIESYLEAIGVEGFTMESN